MEKRHSEKGEKPNEENEYLKKRHRIALLPDIFIHSLFLFLSISFSADFATASGGFSVGPNTPYAADLFSLFVHFPISLSQPLIAFSAELVFHFRHFIFGDNNCY